MKEFKKIGIVGLGLIGGSIAKAIKKRNKEIKVYGFSRRRTTLIKAKKQNIVDSYFLNFEKLLRSSELLILCTPIDKIEYYFREIKKSNKRVILTDVASVKEEIVKMGEKILGKKFPFIGSHPMTGSEKTGLDASSDNLFEGKNVIITPIKYSEKDILRKIENFWKFLGSKPFLLSPSYHDKFVSLTSHLPHLIVFQFLKMLSEKDGKLKKCIGTGFIDTTRIGKSDIEMWVEIFSLNRENILKGIEQFQKEMEKTKRFIEKGEKSKIIKEFEKGKKWREKIEQKREID